MAQFRDSLGSHSTETDDRFLEKIEYNELNKVEYNEFKKKQRMSKAGTGL
jgi:hypothetical protein